MTHLVQLEDIQRNSLETRTFYIFRLVHGLSVIFNFSRCRNRHEKRSVVSRFTLRPLQRPLFIVVFNSSTPFSIVGHWSAVLSHSQGEGGTRSYDPLIFWAYPLFPINKTPYIIPKMFLAHVPLDPENFALFPWSPNFPTFICLFTCLFIV